MPENKQDRQYLEDELREEGPMEAVEDDLRKAKEKVTPGSSGSARHDPDEGRGSAERESEQGQDHQYLEDELRAEGPMEAVEDDVKTAKDKVKDKVKDAVTRDSDRSNS